LLCQIIAYLLALCRYGLYDYWLVKLFPETLSTSGFSVTNCIVYPNPTTDLINISFGEQQEKVTATLTTLLGQVVSRETYSGIQNTSYPITGANGIYFLTLENESHQKNTIKIMKN
jgi:Secretion system C-terminal sorting domain